MHAADPRAAGSNGGPGPTPRRLGWWAAAALAAAALAFSLLRPPRPRLVWNASPSSPVGLYLVADPRSPGVGDMVIARAPPAARRIAAARGYLPLGVPLVKQVAAAAGDRVCAIRDRILVNGRTVALRLARDPSGRAMPWWSGCASLRRGELLLLSQHRRDSFDGRYFGVTRASELVGEARLLWARPTNGHGRG